MQADDGVLDAILDGTPLNWETVTHASRTKVEILHHLETLDRIAAAFRTHAWQLQHGPAGDVQARDVEPPPAAL